MSRASLALAICVTTGCGLDLAGELLAVSPETTSQEAGEASAPHTPDLALALDGASDCVLVPDSAPPRSDAGALLYEASDDTGWTNNDTTSVLGDGSAIDSVVAPNPDSNEGASSSDGGPDQFAAADPDASDDAASACDQLMQCCNQLTMAGAAAPILAACLAEQADAGGCDALLADFTAAGLCP
jgi:hypothetical protein